MNSQPEFTDEQSETMTEKEIEPQKSTSPSLTTIEFELEKIHGEQKVDASALNTDSVESSLITADDPTIGDESATVSKDEHVESQYNGQLDDVNDESQEAVIKLEHLEASPNILRKKHYPFVIPKTEAEEPEPDLYFNDSTLSTVERTGSLYSCLLCTGEDVAVGDMRAIALHMKMAHDVRIYICDVCGQDFRKRTEYSTHMDFHVANEEGDFQCDICNRIYNNLRLFRIHRRMHVPQSKSWECSICSKRYGSKNLLDEHMNAHTGNRPYICGICKKNFASKYTFRAHEKTHGVRPRPYQCNYCSKSFLSQQNLTQHERTHTGAKDYMCNLCGKRFGSAHNLDVHSVVHTGYKPYICSICSKAFARKAEIRDHERIHTGERPYQCETCGATFSQRSNLQSHKRATHLDDKRYICNECDKGFKRRRLLDYHIKAAHTGERPHKCNICDATFVYPEHFKKHRRIHTGEKPYACEVCGKAFNSRDNRNAHRFVHSDKKPYECLVCGAGFMRKPLLYQHMQNQGHINDTIVVNQPRLTTDDGDRMLTLNAKGEMELVDSSTMMYAATRGHMIRNLGSSGSLLMHHASQGLIDDDMDEDDEESLHGEAKLYITENGMIANNDEHAVEDEEDEDSKQLLEHIIIDGQHIRFANAGDLEGTEEKDIRTITSEELAESESQFVETPEGTIQLVKVRIANENGEEEDAWIKIVPE